MEINLQNVEFVQAMMLPGHCDCLERLSNELLDLYREWSNADLSCSLYTRKLRRLRLCQYLFE